MSGLPNTRVDLEVIEALDFEFAPGCEHSQHGTHTEVHAGDAYALVRAEHECGMSALLYLCRPFVDAVMAGRSVNCRGCGEVISNAYTVVALVGSSS